MATIESSVSIPPRRSYAAKMARIQKTKNEPQRTPSPENYTTLPVLSSRLLRAMTIAQCPGSNPSLYAICSTLQENGIIEAQKYNFRMRSKKVSAQKGISLNQSEQLTVVTAYLLKRMSGANPIASGKALKVFRV